MKERQMLVGILIALAGLMLVLPTVHAITYTNADNVDLKITLVNQEPDPAEPNGYVDVRFKVENWGTKIAENVTVELLQTFPFSFELGDSAVKNLGSIGGMQIGDNAVIIKYRLRIDKNAVEGSNPVTLRYRTADSQSWLKIDDFDISIRTHNSILSLEDIKTDPAVIEPGKTAIVYVEVKNLADAVLRNIKVKFDLSSASIPLVPMGSISEKTIYQLGPNEAVFMNFNVMATGTATCGVYKVPITLSYQDRLGQNFTKSDVTGIVVCQKPEIEAMLDTADFLKTPVQITIKVVNRGTTDIKFLAVTLENTKDFEVNSQPYVYVGSVDSDDYETADYTITIHKTKEKEISLPLSLSYKDANNNEYTTKANLALKLQKQKKSSGWPGLIAVLAIAVVMYFVYKRVCKKKKS